MDKEQKELKAFLEQQLKWAKEQTRILDQIDEKLHQMKRIAIYAAEHDLPEYEIDESNTRINELKQEVHMLERQRNGAVH